MTGGLAVLSGKETEDVESTRGLVMGAATTRRYLEREKMLLVAPRKRGDIIYL